MKVLHYGETSWTLGDEAADTLMEYAVVLAHREAASTVDVKARDAEGREQLVTFLLGPATMMTLEPTESTDPEPDNRDVIATLRTQIDRPASPPFASTETADPSASYFDDGF